MKNYTAQLSAKKSIIQPLYGPNFIVDKDNIVHFRETKQPIILNSKVNQAQMNNNRNLTNENNIQKPLLLQENTQRKQYCQSKNIEGSPIKLSWKKQLKTNKNLNPEDIISSKKANAGEKVRLLNEKISSQEGVQLIDNFQVRNVPKMDVQQFQRDVKCCAFGNKVQYNSKAPYSGWK